MTGPISQHFTQQSKQVRQSQHTMEEKRHCDDSRSGSCVPPPVHTSSSKEQGIYMAKLISMPTAAIMNSIRRPIMNR